jgi:diguanylate cyclase (GGDEF)-like protein
MTSRYGSLTAYSWTLATATGLWLAVELSRVTAFPPLWSVALCIAACLFVFQLGVPGPRVGLISMERVPQIGLLLVLEPTLAAAICAFASLLWPFINRRYSQGSPKVALLRGVHNAGMTALMMLVAGRVYVAMGGRLPLNTLIVADIAPLLAMALVAQVINISLMTFYYRFDGREVRQIVTPSYALSDLIFVPAGILAALLFNASSPATFALFVALMVVFVLSFNALGQSSASAQLNRSPLARMFQTRRALHGARSIDTLGERVVKEARTLLRFDEFYLVLADRERQLLDVRVHERGETRLPPRTKPLRAGLFGWLVERGTSVLVSDWPNAPEELRARAEVTEATTGSVIAVPLLEGDTVIGLLSVQHTKAGAYSEADLHLLERLAEEVAVAVTDARAFEDAEEYRQRLEQRVAERTEELEKAGRENLRLIAALREHSQTLERESQEDALTGIANRRCLMQRLAAEVEVAKAMGHPLTLAIADLDLFKAVNDRLGHRIGDEALQRSAALMKDLCRPTDMVGRIGGEEFALILPGTPCAAAIQVCEGMRNAIESHVWRSVHADLRLTISIGLWQWDGKSSVSELLHAADTQLYEAKRGGRNRVA